MVSSIAWSSRIHAMVDIPVDSRMRLICGVAHVSETGFIVAAFIVSVATLWLTAVRHRG